MYAAGARRAKIATIFLAVASPPFLSHTTTDASLLVSMKKRTALKECTASEHAFEGSTLAEKQATPQDEATELHEQLNIAGKATAAATMQYAVSGARKHARRAEIPAAMAHDAQLMRVLLQHVRADDDTADLISAELETSQSGVVDAAAEPSKLHQRLAAAEAAIAEMPALRARVAAQLQLFAGMEAALAAANSQVRSRLRLSQCRR